MSSPHDALCGCSECFIKAMGGSGDSVVIADLRQAAALAERLDRVARGGGPYQGALAHIEKHPGTGSSLRLARLLLSLWNGEDCGFSIRECIEGLDAERLHIALGCVTWFAQHGETAELVDVGYRVYELYPRQWELGVAARDAKAALRAKWDAEYETKIAIEEQEALERELKRDCGDAGEWDSPGVRR